MRDYLRTVELVEALARMVNRVIQHGKAEAQSALGSIEEIRTTLAAVANIDDFFDDLGPLWRCDKPSNERLDLCCRVSICQMRENGPESAPEGHGRAPRADLPYLRASTTGRASPGWAWTRSGRRLTGTFGRPGGKLPSEHIEVESGKNNDRQQLQPCHLARLARNQVRFGLRQAAQCGGAAANASGERRPGQAAASEPLQAPPGLAGIGPMVFPE